MSDTVCVILPLLGNCIYMTAKCVYSGKQLIFKCLVALMSSRGKGGEKTTSSIAQGS